MRKKVNKLLNGVLLMLLVPVVLTICYQKMRLDMVWEKNFAPTEDQIERQLLGILAKEIGADADMELLKAQSVIARTNVKAALEKNSELPEAYTEEELRRIWGSRYEECSERLKRAVQGSAGEVLTYQGDAIYAAFHAISAGNTRNMWELYQNSNMPYLKAQICHDDMQNADYIFVYFWERNEFLDMCKSLFPGSAPSDTQDVEITKRDSSGYVLSVRVGNVICSGEEFRSLLGLASSNFSITNLEGDVRIVTLGQGHGFGMSQNMASVLAAEGKSYREILAYFYPGTEITK